jgi:hypothetical protein
VIACEPQVTIKFKRLFEKISKATYGVMVLKDSRETCRDIAWMLERYPMEISAYDLRYLRARAAEHRRLEQDVANIVAADYQPREFALALPPREYQRVAADLLLRRDSLLLADMLGLGKTVTAICTLVAPDALPALIVVPKHLQRQWQREINRFAPGLSTHIIRTGTPYDLTKIGRRKVPYPDVIICTYNKLVGWADELAGTMREVVFDEAHELRHSGTNKYNAAKFVADKAERRLAMSVGQDTWVELRGGCLELVAMIGRIRVGFVYFDEARRGRLRRRDSEERPGTDVDQLRLCMGATEVAHPSPCTSIHDVDPCRRRSPVGDCRSFALPDQRRHALVCAIG